MKKIAIFLISFYRVFLSPFLTVIFGRGCRYNVTCSQYSIIAFKKYNFSKAVRISLHRFFSCHSFS